jgi:hypothetical protein
LLILFIPNKIIAIITGCSTGFFYLRTTSHLINPPTSTAQRIVPSIIAYIYS